MTGQPTDPREQAIWGFHWRNFRHWRVFLRTLFPRVFWTVVERDGRPELVIWREWLGDSYDIASLSGDWGRWDKKRLAALSVPSVREHPEGDEQ